MPINNPNPQTTVKSSAIVPSKLFGEDRYQSYLDELTSQGTIGGESLTPEQRKEGFKKRGNKIDFEKFVDKVLQKKSSVGISAGQRALPGRGGAIVKSTKIQAVDLKKSTDENQQILEKIDEVIKSIWKSLSDEEKQKKRSDRKRKERLDKEQKTAKETSLEKISKGIVNALEKTFKPITDVFAKIKNALMLLLVGWIGNRLFDWIQDPKNLETFNAIVDFLSRNAGKLLLLFVALNNPLIKVVRWLGRNMISFLVRMIADLTKGKGILNTLKRGRRGGLLGSAARVVTNPGVMATAGVIGGAALANEVTGQRKAASVQAENKARSQTGQGLGVQGVGGVGDMGSTTPYGLLGGTGMMGEQNFDDGGVVRGPSGIDKVPANLTEGEVVFSKPAVKTFGEDFLLAMNKLGGGTNQPTYSGGRMYASGGGIAITSRRGMRSGKFHQGTDIGAPTGTPLFAFKPGVIQELRRVGRGDAGYGNSVYWTDSDGNGHLYAHLDSFAKGLSAGMQIKKGQLLGTVGSTGRSSGPHLHWETSTDPKDVGRGGPTIKDPLDKYGYMTPFEGKVLPTDKLENPREPSSPDDQTERDFTPLKFATEEDRKLFSSYLKYITQPMARGLEILPAVDLVASTPTASGQPASPSDTSIPSRPAASASASRVEGAARRQIATPP